MLTSMVSVSVGPASCSCVERSFRDEFVMCRMVHLLLELIHNCSCDNFSTAPVLLVRTRSLVHCLLNLLLNIFGNNEVLGRLLIGNPANLLWRKELLSLFHKRSDGTCPKRRQQFTMLFCRRTTTQAIQ